MFHIEIVKLAELQIEQGDLNKAKQSLTKALQYNPNYSWANLRMANLLLKENTVEYAEQHLANVLKADIDKDSNLKDAINVLQGDIYRFKGEYEQAIYYYDEAISSSTNIQILKSALQKQLKILTSISCPDIENLIDKYFYINEEITIYLITFFYHICLKYNLSKYLELINHKYIYYSNDLLKYKINRLLVSGNFERAYDIVSHIDLENQDNKYQILVLYAEINEFIGNILLSIKCIEQALLIKKSINLEVKGILIMAEYDFNISVQKIKNLLLERLSEFETEDFQLLLNNIKYQGSQLFEYILEQKELSNNISNHSSSLGIPCIEHQAIFIIKKCLNDIKNNKLDIDMVFNFLENVKLNSLLKREILIQIYNATYNNLNDHILFIDYLNKFISNSDFYYQKIVQKQNSNNKINLNNSFVIVLNSSNIGDTILYLYSLFELSTISDKKIILITCFENRDIINLVKDNWIESIILLAKQDIIERYCPYQEVRPVLLGSITYLSQGGKDRLKVSTKDGVWFGNFLNFRRLNILDYYLRTSNKNYNNIGASQIIYYSFSQIIKNNVSIIYNAKNLAQNTVVVAPIANSLGYYYNLSEMSNLWISIVNYLTSAGFIVRLVKSNKEFCEETDDLVKCVVKHCSNHHQVAEIDMNLIDFIKYIETVDYFIGVRSGMCDLINFIDNKNQRRICIYPPKVNYCFGLSNWMENNFIEYQLPENYINQLQQITQEICSFLGINS